MHGLCCHFSSCTFLVIKSFPHTPERYLLILPAHRAHSRDEDQVKSPQLPSPANPSLWHELHGEAPQPRLQEFLTFVYICPVSSHGLCQKYINAVPLGFFWKCWIPVTEASCKMGYDIQVHEPWKINSSAMPPAVLVLPSHHLSSDCKAILQPPGHATVLLAPVATYLKAESEMPQGSSGKPARVSQTLQTLEKDWRRQRWTQSDTPLQGWCLFWCTAVLGVSLFYQLLRRGTLWYSSCSHCASQDAMFQHVGEMPNPCVTRSSPRES